MGTFTRREWIKPAMLVFGAQAANAAKGSNKHGSKCGESVTRYGSSCGIRAGSKCQTRSGNSCQTRAGSKCQTRAGSKCQTRAGSKCQTRAGNWC